jgi:hypothetical protein
MELAESGMTEPNFPHSATLYANTYLVSTLKAEA